MSDPSHLHDTNAAYAPDTLEDARRLFAGPCDFMLGVTRLDALPEEGPPEVAFAGRSNVGKSSLINALTGRKGLARASNTPGRTRELNYFNLGGVLRLVDLPGYGHAKAAKSDISQWTELTRDFMRGRSTLRRTFILVDARHGLKPTDHEVMSLLDESAAVYQVVLTKADKIKPSGLPGLIAATGKAISRRPAAHPVVMASSADKGTGLAALRAEIHLLAA